MPRTRSTTLLSHLFTFGCDKKMQDIRRNLRKTWMEWRAVNDQTLQAALDAQIEDHEDELRAVSATSKHGDYNLIAAGLEEFKVILQIKNKKDSMRPGSNLEFVLWKAIESWAGGRLDLKQNGRDQTNRSGMKSVENCRKVFDALLGMYSSDHELHQWMTVEVDKWQRLNDTLFDISCFLKSQRKQSPEVLDMKLLGLYCW